MFGDLSIPTKRLCTNHDLGPLGAIQTLLKNIKTKHLSMQIALPLLSDCPAQSDRY
jgi:hypothetical protein